MNCMFLIFFNIVWLILYTYVYGEEINCIKRVADLYSNLTNGPKCLNSSSVDDVKEYVKNSSQCTCKWTDSETTDNDIRFLVTYGPDTILKLVNKKKTQCNYNKTDLIIECPMTKTTIEPLKSCIIDQCLKQQMPKETEDNETEKSKEPALSQKPEKNPTLNATAIGAAIAGGVILGIFISVIFVAAKQTICRQTSCIERCCSVLSMTSTRNSNRGENVSATSSRPVEMSVYEAIPDKNVYDHLHKKPKTVPKPGRYSTMKEIREIRQNKTDETSQPVEEENVKLSVKNDEKSEINTFQILQQSAEGDDGKTNLDEMQSMGGYFILEKKCTEEKI